MDWRIRWTIYLAAGIPAFGGMPLLFEGRALLPGLDLDRLVYAIAVNGLIGLLNGASFLSGVLTAAALIVLPLVFAGAAVSFLMHLLGLAYPGGPGDYSPHYLALALNMLAVIPLAIGLVLNIPFARIESALMGRTAGVTRREKYLLMVLRVFNHIGFSVIPAALEVVREERWRLFSGTRQDGGGTGRRSPGWGALGELIHLASTCISSALRFIPLWAMEIAELPEPRRGSGAGTGGRPAVPDEDPPTGNSR